MGIFSLNNNNDNNPLFVYNNNMTINYMNHYSPINKSPISLPPISKNIQKNTNSQKKNQEINKNDKILHPKKLFQKNLMKNKNENIKATSMAKLNIYIHSEGKNEENKKNNINEKSIDLNLSNLNKKRDNFYSSLFNNCKENNNINNITKDKNLFLNRINKKQINNIINFYSSTKNNEPKIILKNKAKTENISKKLNDQISYNINKNIDNNNVKNIINEIIKEKVENEKNNILNNISLPIINQEQKSNIINNNINTNNNNISKFKSLENNLNTIIKDEKNIKNETNKSYNKQIDYANVENIDTTLNFLKDLNTDKNNIFIKFLTLIQTHLDIELFFDSLKINNNINSFRKKKQLNGMKFNFIAISSNKLLHLKELINIYFNTLSSIYKNKIQKENDNCITFPIDSFFLYPIINNIFHKCLKIQICFYSILLITLNQINEIEINLLLKNYLTQLLKQVSFPLLIIYETFIKDEFNLKYQDILFGHLKPDFNDNLQKLLQEKKIQRKNNCNNTNSQLIQQISKDLEKCIYSLQYYSSVNIKNSEIKIYGDSLNQMLSSIDLKTLNQFAIIFLDSILYSVLEENHAKIKTNNDSNVINTIKDYPPFLPNINPKYKYTLVLDMDETLIHFFFTKNLGMFFVRPYCFDFLYQLNELYEIITFTAGTKEYADYILNLLDPDKEIIKYRLYRQHVTIMGCSVYKDLTKLGRDLSKVIIIDNMKDNFRMQPNNGLYVKTWINDINDYQFKDLLKILKDIALLNVVDVRLIIEKINGKINKENNLINPYYNINIENILNETKR